MVASRHPLRQTAEISVRAGLAAGRFVDATVAGVHRLGSATALPWPHEGQASVMVVGGGSLGTVGSQQPVPIASITKLMTALVVLREHPLRLREAGPLVRIDAAAASESASEIESVVPVAEGQSISLRVLLEYLLVPSGNNIARLLARWCAGSEAAFVRRMNETAAALGMNRTTFTGSCGMDPGNCSTAEDLLLLARAAMDEETLRTVVATPVVLLPDGAAGHTTNRLLGRHGVVGLKTGTTTPAGGNVLWAVTVDVHGTQRLVLGAVLAQRAGRSPVRARAAVWAQTERMVKAIRRAATELPVTEPPGTDPAPAAPAATTLLGHPCR
ncbi:D-alanyl-D-alanine carboxypeptidase family protein [Streptomyces sp. NPDC059009]|uniref:D-alanyl-D-alanine carboxypeptidase family protein n=1 Tax=Streptomyces sp. NPDC059009 TaxID=3346694 RepID=UPI003691A6F0